MGGVESFGHDQREGLSQSLSGRVAKDSLGRPVPMDNVALRVGRDDGVVSAFRHGAEPFFAEAQGLLGPVALGNVLKEDADAVVGKRERRGGINSAANERVTVINLAQGLRLS